MCKKPYVGTEVGGCLIKGGRATEGSKLPDRRPDPSVSFQRHVHAMPRDRKRERERVRTPNQERGKETESLKCGRHRFMHSPKKALLSSLCPKARETKAPQILNPLEPLNPQSLNA